MGAPPHRTLVVGGLYQRRPVTLPGRPRVLSHSRDDLSTRLPHRHLRCAQVPVQVPPACGVDNTAAFVAPGALAGPPASPVSFDGATEMVREATRHHSRWTSSSGVSCAAIAEQLGPVGAGQVQTGPFDQPLIPDGLRRIAGQPLVDTCACAARTRKCRCQSGDRLAAEVIPQAERIPEDKALAGAQHGHVPIPELVGPGHPLRVGGRAVALADLPPARAIAAQSHLVAQTVTGDTETACSGAFSRLRANSRQLWSV